MTEEPRTTVLLAELDALELQMEPLRLGPRRTLRGLVANGAFFLMLTLSGLSLRRAGSLTAFLALAALIGYLPSYLKLRALRRERDALFEGRMPESGRVEDSL